jgi:ABC-2 type transport system permease protein
MGLAGTDLHHAVDFQRQAESYRRDLVRRLNHEHAWGGSKTGDWGFKATAEFFRGVPDFEYRAPGLSFSAAHRRLEVLSLLAWSVGAALAVGLAARRLERD